jgi:sigma-B regulation protein RsbU (phosphoserine phosphatase)
LGKQLEQQMEMARQVQKDLCPPANPSFENLDFAAECVPAWQVGGDFYDIFLTNQGSSALLLGDVSGKGLPAAVLMGLILGAVRSSNWAAGRTEQEASTRRLNELLLSKTSSDRFASLFWGYYEPGTEVLRYVNAGHLPPMVFKQNGELESERLEEGGPVLGVLAAPTYCQGNIAVSAGDLVVLYSDGVVEAMNASEEEFGEERLRRVIRKNSDKSAAKIRDEILKEVRSFLGEAQLQDDLTLVVARLR